MFTHVHATPSLEQVARTVHEVNRGVCLAHGVTDQPSWETAEAWRKDAARKGVAYLVKTPSAGPGALHDAWMAEKRAAGWTHGLVKDAVQKTHPCLVPYAQLPPVEQLKDHLFRATVRSMLGL